MFSHFSTSFTGPKFGNWVVYAHVSLKNGDVEDIVLGIHPDGDNLRSIRGTKHRVYNQHALATNLQGILAKLASLAANDTPMKCPKCKSRWVHAKEPTVTSYKPFKPFLSCDGMQKTKSGAGNPVQCDGTSSALPPVATYR